VLDEGEENPSLILKARYGLGYAYFNLQQYDRALFQLQRICIESTNQFSQPGRWNVAFSDCYFVAKAYSDALVYYKKQPRLNAVDNDTRIFKLEIFSAFSATMRGQKAN